MIVLMGLLMAPTNTQQSLGLDHMVVTIMLPFSCGPHGHYFHAAMQLLYFFYPVLPCVVPLQTSANANNSPLINTIKISIPSILQLYNHYASTQNVIKTQNTSLPVASMWWPKEVCRMSWCVPVGHNPTNALVAFSVQDNDAKSTINYNWKRGPCFWSRKQDPKCVLGMV